MCDFASHFVSVNESLGGSDEAHVGTIATIIHIWVIKFFNGKCFAVWGNKLGGITPI